MSTEIRDGGNWVPWDEAQQLPQIPFADRACDEIIPGLWMGGHDYFPNVGWPVVVGDEFGHVFSLCHRFGHGPDAGVPHEYLSLPDSRLGDRDLERVRNFAGRVYDTYTFDATGQPPKVLVRCRYGYNRSGLVVGLVLRWLGMDPVTAVDLIREKRGPHALGNAWFVSYICDEEARINGKY